MSKSKPVSKKAKTEKASTNPRVRPVPKHQSFRITKKRFRHPVSLPSVITLFRSTINIVWRNKRLFAGIVLVQVILTVIFTQSLGVSSSINELKANTEELLGGTGDLGTQFGTGIALFGYLSSSSGVSSGDISGMYQIILILLVSLATIWAVRQILASELPSIRDVFYKSTYPLVPFILVTLVIGLQLLPALIGNLVYSTVLQQGLAVSAIEKALWFVLFLLFILLSGYMLASSLFALLIVTLPDMTPLRALRSARQLVLHRRFSVLLRVIALPIVLTVFSIIVFVPLLVFMTALAVPLFLVASSVGLVVSIVYMYNLYRALL